MKTSAVLVILLVNVGLPAVTLGDGDFGGLSLDLGTDDSGLENFLNNAINGDGYQDSTGGNYQNVYGNPDDDDNVNFYPVPVMINDNMLGSRHVSSVADLLYLVSGLGGHVLGKGGWLARNILGSLLRVGALVSPTLDAGVDIALNLKHAINQLKRPRDGLLYSKYRLGHDDFSLMHRSKGYLRTHPDQPANLFDTLRRRYTGSD